MTHCLDTIAINVPSLQAGLPWRASRGIQTASGMVFSRLSRHSPSATGVRSSAIRNLSSGPSGAQVPWISYAGEGGLLLRFGTDIDMEVNKKVLAYLKMLDKTPPLSGVKEVLPAYASLLVHFDPLKVSSSEVEQWCRDAAASIQGATGAVDAPRVVSIPVCYGGEYGPDVDAAAQLAGLPSGKELVQMHSEAEYSVYFLGFMGGFPYMGGLPPALASVPRLPTPRQKVPQGAVGIAAGQAGVYTVSAPGGWHLLGQTPMTLFDPSQDPPAMLRAGDVVKFVPSLEDTIPEATAPPPATVEPASPWMEIVNPGPMTTVQAPNPQP